MAERRRATQAPGTGASRLPGPRCLPSSWEPVTVSSGPGSAGRAVQELVLRSRKTRTLLSSPCVLGQCPRTARGASAGSPVRWFVHSASICSAPRRAPGAGLDAGGTGIAKGFVLSHSRSTEQVCQPRAGGELSSNGTKLHALYVEVRFSGNGVCSFRQIFRGFCGPPGGGVSLLRALTRGPLPPPFALPGKLSPSFRAQLSCHPLPPRTSELPA